MPSVQKTRVKLFRLGIPTGGSSRKTRFSRKRPFSADKSDCIRNGLRAQINEEHGKSSFDFFLFVS